MTIDKDLQEQALYDVAEHIMCPISHVRYHAENPDRSATSFAIEQRMQVLQLQRNSETMTIRNNALEEAAQICEGDVQVIGSTSMLAQIRDQVAQFVLADKIRAVKSKI
jgi:hypothetical protein